MFKIQVWQLHIYKVDILLFYDLGFSSISGVPKLGEASPWGDAGGW
jgi:hypothetical protein